MSPLCFVPISYAKETSFTKTVPRGSDSDPMSFIISSTISFAAESVISISTFVLFTSFGEVYIYPNYIRYPIHNSCNFTTDLKYHRVRYEIVARDSLTDKISSPFNQYKERSLSKVGKIARNGEVGSKRIRR